MVELFSSFAISVVANIVTALFARNNTEKEIRKAFQDAIEEWCPNEDIRRYREDAIWEFLQKFMENPSLNMEELSEEEKSFLAVFQKRLAEHPSAAAYLSDIKGQQYYEMVMSSLQIAQHKLDYIKEKLDATDPRHEELHSQAVAEVNGVIEDEVVKPINAILFGVVSAFDDAFIYYDVSQKNVVKVVMDKDSYLDEDNVRKKFHDFDYDWEKEPSMEWPLYTPDIDFWEMFAESYIAGFQIMDIDFFHSVEEIDKIVDANRISQQLSVEEKRLLTDLCQSMRALGGMIEDHDDMLCIAKNVHFENLTVKSLNHFKREGIEYGHYQIAYKTDDYEENVTDVLTLPTLYAPNLLDVVYINKEYYFKLTGYLGEVFNLVKEWWDLSGR